MPRVTIEVRTRNSLTSRKDAREFLKILCEAGEQFVPERYGNWEPLRMPFSEPEEALRAWNWGFLWSRAKPRVEGSVYQSMGPRPTHGSITIVGDFKSPNQDLLVSLLKRLAVTFNADFALVHCLTPADLRVGPKAGTVTLNERSPGKSRLIVTTHMLKRYLPDVFWGTVFGLTYVRHFTKDLIASAPASFVSEIADSMFYLQMCDNLLDCIERPSVVDDIRKLVRDHLNRGSFFDPGKGEEYPYSAPDFALPVTDWDGNGPAEG
ncbi:MAG TPA: hypothetical protein VGX68_19375 [Thermoanaerobaculia bacterium]|jgi:hypothetical protein|nr:hypothetical protein [Thermoanaerobaculia bacterium]